MTFPAFKDAKDDRELRGTPMTVYLHLIDVLDPMQWRELKQTALSSHLGISDRHVRRALDTLVARGYLAREQDAAHIGAPRRYRLVYSRSQPAA